MPEVDRGVQAIAGSAPRRARAATRAGAALAVAVAIVVAAAWAGPAIVLAGALAGPAHPAHPAHPARVAGAGNGWAGAGLARAPGGPYLTDALGRRLELHGVNLVGKCGGGSVDTTAPGTPCVGPAQGPRLAYVLSPRATDPGRRFTAADARTLARLGLNVVRLGIVWEGLEPGPRGIGPDARRYCAPHRRGTPWPALGRADPYNPSVVRAYLARTDMIVTLLARAGLRVILDMHSDVWGSVFADAQGTTPWNGEGAPPWATCTGGHPFVAPVGWGAGYLSTAVQTAIHHFWANDVRADLQGQYARVWQAVARHYRGDPDVLGYEVYNEPDDFLVTQFDPELQCDYGGRAHEPKSCAESHAAALPGGLIGAIQAADRTHVVLFEPSGATGYGAPETVGISEPLRFRGLALAFHVYGPIPYQLSKTLGERARTRTAAPGGPAWIMDEFGASNNAPATANVVNYAGAMNLSWAYWSGMQLHDPTGGAAAEGLLDQRTRRPYRQLASALAVPYPWATAGTPGPQSYDRVTGTYQYRYAVDPSIRAPTDIEVPPDAYRHGYAVTAIGAHRVSAPDASLLELRADRHARRVSLTLRPRPQVPPARVDTKRG